MTTTCRNALVHDNVALVTAAGAAVDASTFATQTTLASVLTATGNRDLIHSTTASASKTVSVNASATIATLLGITIPATTISLLIVPASGVTCYYRIDGAGTDACTSSYATVPSGGFYLTGANATLAVARLFTGSEGNVSISCLVPRS